MSQAKQEPKQSIQVQTDQFKWDAKAVNNRQGSGYTASIYSYSLAAVYFYSFTTKIIFLEVVQG